MDRPSVARKPIRPLSRVYPSMFRYLEGDGLEENDERWLATWKEQVSQ
jgi:hypothetical protein